MREIRKSGLMSGERKRVARDTAPHLDSTVICGPKITGTNLEAGRWLQSSNTPVSCVGKTILARQRKRRQRFQGVVYESTAINLIRRPSTPSAMSPRFRACASLPNTSNRQPCMAGTFGCSSTAMRSMSSEFATSFAAT